MFSSHSLVSQLFYYTSQYPFHCVGKRGKTNNDDNVCDCGTEKTMLHFIRIHHVIAGLC